MDTVSYTHLIPKAIEVSERLRADGSGDRYVWTTGSWLIGKYLRTASPEAVKQLEMCIRDRLHDRRSGYFYLECGFSLFSRSSRVVAGSFP